MSNRKKIDEILGLIPVDGVAPQSQIDLEETSVVYNLTHDILHWLVRSPDAYDHFFADMVKEFESAGKEPPTKDIVWHNVVMLHATFDQMVKVLELMTGHHVATIEDDSTDLPDV